MQTARRRNPSTFRYVSALTILVTFGATGVEGGSAGRNRDDITTGNIATVERRIQEFAEKNHALPRSTSDLPKDPDKADDLVDGYNNAMKYEVLKDGMAILRTTGGGDRSYQFSIVPEDQLLNQDFWTFDHIEYLENFIRDYYEKQGKLPESLKEALLDGSDYKYYATDGWGRPFEYTHDGPTVSITSHGEDGKQFFQYKFNHVKRKTTLPTTETSDRVK